jgi:hypothetical protein
VSAADDARPWWASDRGVTGLGPDPDPLDRHRRARRGDGADDVADGVADDGADGVTDDVADDVTDDATAPRGSWWEPAAEAVARLGRDLATTAADNAAAAVGDRPWHAAEARRDDDPGSAAAADPGSEGDEGHRIDACGVCPICVGLRALGEVRPDLVGHLAEAARHLAAAVRSAVETTAPRSDPGTGSRSGPTRIDLDDDPDGWDDEEEP